MYKNSLVHHLAKLTVDVMFYGGIVCCFLVVFLAKLTRGYAWYGEEVVLPFSVILFLTGVCAVYILFVLKQMFKTLLGGNPFVMRNVSSFRRMAVASLLIAVIYLVKCLFWFTLATAVIMIVFGIAALFCLTLKDIFKQAVYYKEEHDLTV